MGRYTNLSVILHFTHNCSQQRLNFDDRPLIKRLLVECRTVLSSLHRLFSIMYCIIKTLAQYTMSLISASKIRGTIQISHCSQRRRWPKSPDGPTAKARFPLPELTARVDW